MLNLSQQLQSNPHQANLANTVRDQIRFKFVSMNARDLQISAVNCCGVVLSMKGRHFTADSLEDCVDQALEAFDPVNSELVQPARYKSLAL